SGGAGPGPHPPGGRRLGGCPGTVVSPTRAARPSLLAGEEFLDPPPRRRSGVSDPGRLVLTGLAEALEFLAAPALAGLLVVGLATHLLAESAPLAQLAEAADRLLDRLAGTHP